jgi:coenzyme F420-dependent glucose-6-phosphate dehydrogenase
MRYGYKASAEQFPPRRLLDLAVAAEAGRLRIGLDQRPLPAVAYTGGHAPNALDWLGAATQATKRVHARHQRPDALFRYNPAVVAQAFATLGCLAPGG